MYIFRRAAARAISAPRQIRAAPRIASFQSSIPSLSRSFHQSRIWRAEEQKETTSSSTQDAVSESSGTTSEPLGQSEHQSQNVAESASESTKTPLSTSSPQDAVSESSGTTSELVGQSEQSKPVTEQASELAEKAKETVSDAAAKAAQAVGEVTQQPKEKAQEAASEVSEQAQSAASSMARATRNTARSARDAVDGRNPFTQGVTPPSKILYIGNLFFEVTAPQLEAEFGQYGEIVNSRVVTDNRGLSKGFAYVEMATQKEADAALAALNQKAFQGRRMSVQYHKRRTANNNNAKQHDQNKPSKTLFIGNMSYQMSDRDLNDLFRQIRNVLDVRVAIDRRSGQPRGFAHADFIDVESATKAKDILEQKVVYGRQLRVNYSGQSPTDARNNGRENRAPREDRSRDFD